MDALEELERRVGEKWVAAAAARTPDWPVPAVEWSDDWKEAMKKPLPPGTLQFPREQWASYPNQRTVALLIADRLLDFDELTDEQWMQLGLLMQYGGKTRIA